MDESNTRMKQKGSRGAVLKRVGAVCVARRYVSLIAIRRVVGFEPRKRINLEVWLKVVEGRQVLKLADGVLIHLTGSLVLLPHPSVEPSLSLVLLTHPLCLMDLPFTLAHVAVDVRGAPNPFVSPSLSPSSSSPPSSPVFSKPIRNISNNPISKDAIEAE
ncbi:hypothetical protein Tco_1237581 [Tanacetum coccineum]